MRLFRPWFFSSLILGKWNVNGRRGKWLEAGVALFFLKLHARDQQTKWVRERFHNISDGFPYAPRWGTEIFHTQKNFDLPQFVCAKGWSIYIFIPSQNLGRWLLCSLSAPTFPNSPASPRSTHDASCPLLQTSQGAPSPALLPFPLKPSWLSQDTHFYGTPNSPAAHAGHTWVSLEIGHCISRGCTNHSSEETRLKIRAGSIYETYLFCLSEAANYLPVSSLHRWTIKHTADRELFSGTHTLISYKYYSRREQNRYCLLMFPLNTATQMVINASWHA